MLKSISNQKKKIFTYFEEEKIYSYLNLCIKTWQKNISDDYEVVKLNSKNISSYIPQNKLPDPTRAKCSFLHFLDYVSAAVLFYNGGIFLSPEIILTNNFCEKILVDETLLQRTDLVLFSRSQKHEFCSGFMMANKGSKILGKYLKSFETQSLSEVIKDVNLREVIFLDPEECGYLMESSMYGVYNEYIYSKYYFADICATEDFFKTSKGITCLNSSWTPEKYKKMSEQEFLGQDILLAKIFNEIMA